MEQMRNPGQARLAAGTSVIALGIGLLAPWHAALAQTTTETADQSGVVVLDEVTVVVGSGATEDSNSYATGAASIARGADSLKEVPQAVTVMTHQTLQDQNLTTMSEAMTKAPGVVATINGGGNPVYSARGFDIGTYQIDGLGTNYDSTWRPDFDLSIYDRVEVLRGAEGLFSGAGEPGGTVNLVRKRPTDEFSSSISLGYGSWSNRRVEADIGGPITSDGRLRGRMIGVWQDRDYFYSPADEEKQVLYGILEYDLTPDTTVHAGVSYQYQYGTRWATGLPAYSDGTQLGLDRGIALTADWAKRKTTTKEIFVGAEHRFNDDWMLKFGAMRQRFDYDYMQLSLGGPVDPATGIFGDPGAFSEDVGNHSDVVDLNISGRFNAWGKEYKLTAGADWRRSYGKQMRNRYSEVFPDGTVSIDDFPGLDLPSPTSSGGYNHGWPAYGGVQKGVYARLDMEVTDKLNVIVGGRYANYEHNELYLRYDEDGNVTERDSSWHWTENGTFTPYAGVTYDVTPDWTAYASITEIYKPQGNTFAGPPENPTQLDPITGRNFELGAKGAILNGGLNVAASLYHIEREGEGIADTRYEDEGTFYLPLGKVVSQGLDLEVSGEVVPGWQIFAGYTYNRNKNENEDAVYHALTPRHMLKLWSEYNLPGAYDAWTIGGGVTVKSKHANTGTYWQMGPDGWTQPRFEIQQGGYAVWDAHVDYRIDDRWNLSLNVNNLFDKTYYATIGVPNGGNWYGEPRSATLTLRGTF